MNARRLTFLLLALVLGSGALLGALAALRSRATPERVIGEAVLATLAGIASCPALAEEAMKFEPVSEESVRAMERRSGHSAPPAPAPPAAPARPSERLGSIVRIGSDIRIAKDEVVEGDVVALGGDVTVEGHVKGTVTATGGSVHLASTAKIDGDVACLGGELTEDPGAWIGGQRVTAARGGHRRIEGPELPHEGHKWVGRIAAVFGSLVWMLLWLGIAWVVTWFAPTRTAVAVETVRREPGMSLGIGFLSILLLVPSMIAMVLVVAILCITIIGIPLAIATLLGYFALLIVAWGWGFVVGAIPVGQRLLAQLRREEPSTLTREAVFGVLAILGLWFASRVFRVVPFFGWFGALVGILAIVGASLVALSGTGALIRSKFGQGPGGRWWPLRPARPSTLSAPPAPGPVSPPGTEPLAPPPEPPPATAPPIG